MKESKTHPTADVYSMLGVPADASAVTVHIGINQTVVEYTVPDPMPEGFAADAATDEPALDEPAMSEAANKGISEPTPAEDDTKVDTEDESV